MRRTSITAWIAGTLLAASVAGPAAQAAPPSPSAATTTVRWTSDQPAADDEGRSLAPPDPATAAAVAAGCPRTGTNPSRARIADMMDAVATAHGVPHQLLKVIGYKESSWRQFTSGGQTLLSDEQEPGIGLMQLTGATARQFDYCRLFTDTRYNIEAGAKVLLQKMTKAAEGTPAPATDRTLIENWYLATRFYNGGGAAANAYVQDAFAKLRTPPSALAGHTLPTSVTTPRQVWAGYTEPARIRAVSGGTWTFYSTSLSKAVVARGTGSVHAWRSRSNLRNVTSGMCVDIPGFGKGRSGGAVNQYPCDYTSADNQRFWFTGMRKHTGSLGTYTVYQIRNATDSLCLDVPGTGDNSPGALVSESACRGSADNQYWYRVPRSSGSWYVNLKSKLCLDVSGARAGADARLTLFDCSDADDHRWTQART